MQDLVDSSGRQKGGLCPSQGPSRVCWAGFEDLRPKAASHRGTQREGSGSLSPHPDRLCYHCHSSTTPSYVTDMLHIKPLPTRNTRSSSSTMPLLYRHAHSKATLGDRSFSFASSSVWNSIPNDVRCAQSLS